MTGIWGESNLERMEGGWALLPPVPFEAEAVLHDLVERNPQLLPLSGSPVVAILGREVRIGNWLADLVGLETTGRPVIIELKLASNPEARQAVIAQVLTYAAFLQGQGVDEFETVVMGPHLERSGVKSLAEAVQRVDQVGSVEPAELRESLADNLSTGSFRLVFVLDRAPEQLVTLVGYLEMIAPNLVIDLVTVSAFDSSLTQRVLVPQRVDPERFESEIRQPQVPQRKGRLVEGAADFIKSIEEARPEQREEFHRLTEWALQLESEGLVTLSTFLGASGRKTLLPRLKDENVGLVTVWNDNGPLVTGWRSVFERRAPLALGRLDARLAPFAIGQGNTIKDTSDEVLEILLEAHREATREPKA